MHRIDFIRGYVDRFWLHRNIQELIGAVLRFRILDIGNFESTLVLIIRLVTPKEYLRRTMPSSVYQLLPRTYRAGEGKGHLHQRQCQTRSLSASLISELDSSERRYQRCLAQCRTSQESYQIPVSSLSGVQRLIRTLLLGLCIYNTINDLEVQHIPHPADGGISPKITTSEGESPSKREDSTLRASNISLAM